MVSIDRTKSGNVAEKTKRLLAVFGKPGSIIGGNGSELTGKPYLTS